MSNEAVCRTAPATPGLSKKLELGKGRKEPTAHWLRMKLFLVDAAGFKDIVLVVKLSPLSVLRWSGNYTSRAPLAELSR